MAKSTKKKASAAIETGKGHFALEALAFASAADKNVTFTCSSPTCLVTITAGLLKARFVTRGRMLLPVGSFLIDVAVAGPTGAPFTLAATGATMTPLTDTASVSALLPITV